MVNDTETTLQCHVDSHLVLSDSVHGGRHKGSLKCDALGDGGVELDSGGREANVTRQQQEVVVGQTAVLSGIHELVNIEAIAGLVLLEELKSLGVVEGLGGRSAVDARHDCEEEERMRKKDYEVEDGRQTSRWREKKEREIVRNVASALESVASFDPRNRVLRLIRRFFP